jgi:hypothetical protein
MTTAPRRDATCADLGARGSVLLLVIMCASVGAATARAHRVTRVTSVVVTITDSQLKLSRPSVIGSVVFNVVNKSRLPRDFEIAGKRTPSIASGASAPLRVELPKSGAYPYVSAGPGRASRLRGMLRVAVPCTHPSASTVSVRLSEEGTSLSQARIPCGTVTFAVTNGGTIVHSFQVPTQTNFLVADPGGHTARLKPGSSARFKVRFVSKGIALYSCGEPEHDEMFAESGWITVV